MTTASTCTRLTVMRMTLSEGWGCKACGAGVSASARARVRKRTVRIRRMFKWDNSPSFTMTACGPIRLRTIGNAGGSGVLHLRRRQADHGGFAGLHLHQDAVEQGRGTPLVDHQQPVTAGRQPVDRERAVVLGRSGGRRPAKDAGRCRPENQDERVLAG